jgi:hypothetical protein
MGKLPVCFCKHYLRNIDVLDRIIKSANQHIYYIPVSLSKINQVMLLALHPRLPMRNKAITFNFYVNQLGFTALNDMATYPDYLMVKKDGIEIHFFLYEDLNEKENYGSCYIRTDNVTEWYQLAVDKKLDIPELGHLHQKPWGQKEFALRDPDCNLLTFGENTWKG